MATLGLQHAVKSWIAGPSLASVASLTRIRPATKKTPPKEAWLASDGQYVQAKLDSRMTRFGCKRAALMMAHALWPRTPIETIVEAFGTVVKSGKASQIGCCNVGPERPNGGRPGFSNTTSPSSRAASGQGPRN